VLEILTDLVWSNLASLILLAGAVGLLLALAVTIRISRGDDEAVAAWRYRETAGEGLSRAAGPSRADARAGRWMARQLLAVAVALPFLLLIGWVMQPGSFSGMYDPPWYVEALPWAGGAGYLLGLAWMIRIYRADPEPGETTWRYRS
jgi:hypothetical protein